MRLVSRSAVVSVLLVLASLGVASALVGDYPPCMPGPRVVMLLSPPAGFPVAGAPRYSFIVPPTLVKGSCVMYGGVLGGYALLGDIALVYGEGRVASVVAGGGCGPEDPMGVLPALIAELKVKGFVDTSFKLPGWFDVGSPSVTGWSSDAAILTFVPPARTTMASGLLSLGASVDTLLHPYSLYARLRVESGALALGAGNVVAVFSENGTLRVVDASSGEVLDELVFNPNATQEVTMPVFNGTLYLFVNDTLVGSYRLETISIDGFIVAMLPANASSVDIATALLYAIVVPGVLVPPGLQALEQSPAILSVTGPTTVQFSKWYLYTVSIEDAPSGTIYVYPAGSRPIAEADTNPPATVTFNITVTSTVAVAGCLVFAYVSEDGVLLALYGVELNVLTTYGSESWVISFNIPLGGHGYVVYADGRWVKTDAPYTLILAGFGWSGCTVTLQVGGTTVYTVDVPVTALDVYIPLNFTTPARVTITKSVSSTSCSVTIDVQKLEYLEVAATPPLEVYTSPPHEKPLPGILTILSSHASIVYMLVAAFTATTLLLIFKTSGSLSTAVTLTALMLLAVGLLLGGDEGARITSVSVLLLALGLGLKLGYR